MKTVTIDKDDWDQIQEALKRIDHIMDATITAHRNDKDGRKTKKTMPIKIDWAEAVWQQAVEARLVKPVGEE